MKTKTWLLAAAMALACGPAFAADQIGYQLGGGNTNTQAVDPAHPLPVGQKAGPQAPLGYQQIVGLSSATVLTVPTGATIAYVTVEGQAVRWRADGTAPTASVGNPVAAGAQVVFSVTPLSALQFIQQTSSATIDVAYFQ